jgi:nicotinate-nucleotide adenylyltransferase
MSVRRERLGLLGGTFDPVHHGHLQAAVAVQTALGLDRVVLVPASVPPHRPAQPRVSAFHRFAMTAMAVQSREGLEVSDIELLSSGPSYTANTLSAFHARGFAASQLFFITGADAFAEIATWRQYPALLDAAHFVVVSRPGHVHDDLCHRAPAIRSRVVDLRGQGGTRTKIPPTPSVIFLDAATSDASSTAVRQRLAAGLGVDDLVPAAVRSHIERHHLYRPPDGGSPLA